MEQTKNKVSQVKPMKRGERLARHVAKQALGKEKQATIGENMRAVGYAETTSLKQTSSTTRRERYLQALEAVATPAVISEQAIDLAKQRDDYPTALKAVELVMRSLGVLTEDGGANNHAIFLGGLTIQSDAAEPQVIASHVKNEGAAD